MKDSVLPVVIFRFMRPLLRFIPLLLAFPAIAILCQAEEPPLTVSLSGNANPTVASGNFSLTKGDVIAIIGNGLADRMQHDGWTETFLQVAQPDK